MKLQLEVNQNTEEVQRSADGSILAGGRLMITPPVGEDFWIMRVKVGHGQALLGFPKFSTIGIGFAKEEDWNTNLPYLCDTEEIYAHIQHNKGHARISRETCIEAIRMIQAEAHRLRGTNPERDKIRG